MFVLRCYFVVYLLIEHCIVHGVAFVLVHSFQKTSLVEFGGGTVSDEGASENSRCIATVLPYVQYASDVHQRKTANQRALQTARHSARLRLQSESTTHTNLYRLAVNCARDIYPPVHVSTNDGEKKKMCVQQSEYYLYHSTTVPRCLPIGICCSGSRGSNPGAFRAVVGEDALE